MIDDSPDIIRHVFPMFEGGHPNCMLYNKNIVTGRPDIVPIMDTKLMEITLRISRAEIDLILYLSMYCLCFNNVTTNIKVLRTIPN